MRELTTEAESALSKSLGWALLVFLGLIIYYFAITGPKNRGDESFRTGYWVTGSIVALVAFTACFLKDKPRFIFEEMKNQYNENLKQSQSEYTRHNKYN